MFVILSAALKDIQEARDRYNEQQKGLGARFTKLVRASVKRISRYPYQTAVRYDQIRMSQLSVFPCLFTIILMNQLSLW